MFTLQAFSAWHSLVVVQSDAMREICLSVTPNDELPSELAIWLDLIDLLQVRECACVIRGKEAHDGLTEMRCY